MGLLKRLFGAGPETSQYSERRVGAECKRTVAVVGEFYRAGVAQLVRRIECDEVTALLVPEPTNRHDPNAVKVLILGEHVGYLSRKHALDYQPALQLAAQHGEVLAVRANAHKYGSGEYERHEVVMYLPTMKSLMRELEAAYASDVGPA